MTMMKSLAFTLLCLLTSLSTMTSARFLPTSVKRSGLNSTDLNSTSSSPSFTIIGIRTSLPPEQQQLNASSGHFFLGKPTMSYRSGLSLTKEPPNWDATVFIPSHGGEDGMGGIGGNGTSSTVELDVHGPVLQAVYIDKKTGALSYPRLHKQVPAHAITSPFTLQPHPDTGPGVSSFSIPGNALACPIDPKSELEIYQVFSKKHYKGKVKKCDCHDVDLRAVDYTGESAYEYV